ncbi:hypothetical protein [Micromonospora sp. NPDC048898]|uniref:hypothetical protein n=1 Tax=Micromonospora sp. NPDC048898 TaxID=3364260 RepID=UPI003718F906
MSSGTRWLIMVLAWVVASAGVLLGIRLATNAHAEDSAAAVPTASALDANSTTSTGGADRRLPGTTRLVALKPTPLLDSRTSDALAEGAAGGAEVSLPMPQLPTGTRDVLVEVSILAATGPGKVTLGSGEDKVTVLNVAKAKAQQSATAVARRSADGTLQVGLTSGGDLLVRLVGAFEPVERSDAGRVVPVTPTPVVRLVPKEEGKRTSFALADVPQLATAGPVSAIVLQVSADVGTHGGFVSAGTSATALTQTVYWSATAGADRTRVGLLFVPVSAGKVFLRYEAGTELRADLVGYVTGTGAPVEVAGLTVPVPPHTPGPTSVPAKSGVDVAIGATGKLVDVPAERIGAALLTLTAIGEATGEVTVRQPGTRDAASPTLIAAKGTARSASTLVATTNAAVRVDSAVAGSVTVTPRLLVLNQ